MTTLAEIDAWLLADDPEPTVPAAVVSANDLADWLGLSPSRIHAAAREGRIPRRADGSFDLKPAVRAYVEFLRAKGGSTLAANPELNAEKIRLARESADKVSLQNARARGEMVATADVARAWAEIVTDLRAALLAVPARVAGAAGLDRRATAALDQELRAAMEGIADDA